jgi:hypothetical protein
VSSRRVIVTSSGTTTSAKALDVDDLRERARRARRRALLTLLLLVLARIAPTFWAYVAVVWMLGNWAWAKACSFTADHQPGRGQRR